MSMQHTLSLSILAIALAGAAGQALGADAAGGPTRDEVKAAVLKARASGELRPAGEATEPLTIRNAPSMLTQRQVREATLQARAHGELVPAGEGSPLVAQGGTRMARAEVRESTRQARADGELVPAGEGFGPVESHARGPARRAEMVAARR